MLVTGALDARVDHVRVSDDSAYPNPVTRRAVQGMIEFRWPWARTSDGGVAQVIEPVVQVIGSRLSGGERWGFEASMVKTHINGNIVPDPKKLGEKQVRFVALTLANEDGSRVFSDADLEEVKTLGSRALDELYDFAEKLNATDEEAVEEAKKN